MKVYVINMYRNGDEESHSYLDSVEETLNEAIVVAKEAETYRGGKYESEIIEIEVGNPSSKKYLKNIYTRMSARNSKMN